MLKGEHIILRPLRLSDWEKTMQWRNDSDIKQLAMMHPYPVTEFLDEKDDPLGYIFLNNINQINRNCSLGIVIGDINQRGKGIGTEAIELISGYAFKTLNLNKVTVEVVEKNVNAVNLYKKLGFLEEGKLKQQYFSDDQYFDVLIMSLFKSN
jgi:RimJ/RimL family protein N-acetyltransferase